LYTFTPPTIQFNRIFPNNSIEPAGTIDIIQIADLFMYIAV